MLPFSFTQCESKWFGSHTDLLALLHTAPYCPPGHNRPKCFKSPEWKWGLFFLTASFKATPGALKAPRSTAPWINEGNLAAGRSTFDPHYSFTQLGPGTRKLPSLWGWWRLGGGIICVPAWLFALHHLNRDVLLNSELKWQGQKCFQLGLLKRSPMFTPLLDSLSLCLCSSATQ